LIVGTQRHACRLAAAAFQHGSLRVRTDFFTRPPRISAAQLSALWARSPETDPPFTDAVLLA